MRLICLDYGEKRTGVAVNGGSASLAIPHGVILKNTRKAYFDQLLKIITAEQAEAVVIGLPLREDGTDSLTTRQVRNFAASLKNRTSRPVYFMNEAYSSDEAQAMLRQSGQKSRHRDGRLDSLAAARILQSFLNLHPEQRQLA
jgi:putative Holliday junction resolvase